MGYMVYGAAGALLALAMVAAGFGMGWELCRLWKRRAREAGDWDLLVEENTRLQKELCRRLREPEERKAGAMPTSRETEEEQRREAEERQRAFESMLNYNPATAYGTEAPIEELIREGDR